MLYLMMSVVLMAMDQRGQYVPRIRSAIETGLEPVYHLMGLPSRVAQAVFAYSRSYSDLVTENETVCKLSCAQSGAVQQLDSLQ